MSDQTDSKPKPLGTVHLDGRRNAAAAQRDDDVPAAFYGGASIEWTDAERATLEAANAAAGAIQRWLGIEERLAIGNGLIILERRALVLSGKDRPGKGPYKKAWDKLVEDFPRIAAIKHQSERSRHQRLAETWQQIEPWLQTVPANIMMRLASPKAILDRYDHDHKPPSPKKTSPAEQARLDAQDQATGFREAHDRLQAEIYRRDTEIHRLRTELNDLRLEAEQEVDRLQAEIDRRDTEIWRLQEKIDGDGRKRLLSVETTEASHLHPDRRSSALNDDDPAKIDLTITQRSKNADDIWTAEDEGYRCGRRGGAIDECPYTPGTEVQVHWHDWWRKGQAAIARELGPDGAVASTTRKHPRRRQPRLPGTETIAKAPGPGRGAPGRKRGPRRKANGGAETAAVRVGLAPDPVSERRGNDGQG